MGKVAIVTFNDAINYGAVLQEYALYYSIKKLGYEVDVVGYKNDLFAQKYKLRIRGGRTLKTIIGHQINNLFEYSKRKKFKKFKSENISEVEFDNVNQIDYVCFVAGSDQIWNSKITNANRYYFLSWVNDDNKKCSYAASIGMDMIPEALKGQYETDLNRFPPQNISVREHEAASIIESILGYKPKVVCDPVLLVDKKIWESIADKDKFECNSPYLFVYLFDYKEEDVNKIISFADGNGLKIVWVQNTNKHSDKIKFVRNAGIESWLSMIESSSYVITDSYHAMLFSIIFKKGVSVFERVAEGKSNTRIDTVLYELGIMNCKTKTLNVEMNNIDYFEVEKRLKYFKSQSVDFLKDIISKSCEFIEF